MDNYLLLGKIEIIKFMRSFASPPLGLVECKTLLEIWGDVHGYTHSDWKITYFGDIKSLCRAIGKVLRSEWTLDCNEKTLTHTSPVTRDEIANL